MAAALTLLVAVPAAAAAASDDERVVFEGRGWGHGVGLSQYGAYAMALDGAGHREILSHYYRGTSVESVGETPPLWVNLERNATELRLRVEPLRTGATGAVVMTVGGEEVVAEIGASIDFTASGAGGCVVVVNNPSRRPESRTQSHCASDLVWYRWRTVGVSPAIKLVVAGCTQADWNVEPMQRRPCEYARGMMHVRAGTGGLDLSAEMLMEDYVLGVSEMPYHWGTGGGEAALRAQAVAARSYARELQLTRGDPAANSCDAWCHVRDTTFDQRYVGWGHGTPEWVAAVRETAGQVVTHPEAPNRIVRTYFFSSSGGRTENGHDRFGWLEPAEYLTSVDDRHGLSRAVDNPKASWVVAVGAAEVAAAVGLDQLTGVEVGTRRPGSESASEVRFVGVLRGERTVVSRSSSWTRTTFGLFSEFFSTRLSGSGRCVTVTPGDGWWTATVRLGLPGSQWQAVRDANPDAMTGGGLLRRGSEVCASTAGGASAAADPARTAACTVVLSGEGWWHQALKLDLDPDEWPTLVAANSGAVTATGRLRSGATVCIPGSGNAGSAGSSCTTARSGDGWIAVGVRIGWPSATWRTLAAANPAAATTGGYLRAGAEVCRP